MSVALGKPPRLEAERVAVSLGARSYDVVIGSGLIDAAETFTALAGGRRAVLVTNEVVGPLYANRARRALERRFDHVSVLTLADGEDSKRWETLNGVFDHLLAERCDRSTTLVALGGGVVGDLTGFAAACYMRGIAYVQVPTTLLAQVDSSVGGKTAINHPAGKNMIGAFHQPGLVVADVSVLATLPRRELVAGLAEVIKYGATLDAGFLNWIDEHLPDLLAGEPKALVHAVRRSCELKAAIVAADEQESGVRALLNFGHTFGHAIEAALGYGAWLHGEAVGCGMVLAARLSERMGLIEPERARRLREIVERAGLPTCAPAVDAAVLVRWMDVDKKAAAGERRFVLLQGETAALVSPAPESLVIDVVRQSQAR